MEDVHPAGNQPIQWKKYSRPVGWPASRHPAGLVEVENLGGNLPAV
jgi:hypothetical protein